MLNLKKKKEEIGLKTPLLELVNPTKTPCNCTHTLCTHTPCSPKHHAFFLTYFQHFWQTGYLFLKKASPLLQDEPCKQRVAAVAGQ